MCDIQNNGKIQREFETRSTDDQPTIQWLPVVGSWTFLGVNMHFNEKLFMCDSCNFLVRAYLFVINKVIEARLIIGLYLVNQILKFLVKPTIGMKCT